MLGSITPLGERGRNSTWGVTVAFFVGSSTLAGASLGAALGLIAASVDAQEPRFVFWLLAVAIMVGVALDGHLLGAHLPSTRRQVRNRWLYRYRGWVYGSGFGFQLGLGVVTVVSISAVYVAFLAAFLSQSAFGGAAIGFTFGLLRGLSLLPAGWVRTPQQLLHLDSVIERLGVQSARVAIALEVAAGITSAIFAVTR